MRFFLFVFVSFLLIAPANLQAQEKTPKVDTLHIETSAVCGMCKDRLESELGFVKGVKSVELDLDSKRLTIVYRTKKVSKEALRQKVADTGYRADHLPANPEAFMALPACCQAEGCSH